MSDPIRVGHPDDGTALDSCGCCDGTALATLQPTANRPNLSAIAFRAGDHSSFKASMLTSLSSSAYPALARLRTREDDDFSVALIDAWASACDVLTFYQERLANEAYMGTATERLSIGELARLIGYRLHPGSAAETDLVILMEDPPGAAPDVTDLTVPAGTRVQSQPGPDEVAQVFETIADLQARVGWNALRARQTRPALPRNGDTSMWVAGNAALSVGDVLLFVTQDRMDTAASPLWDRRRVTAVEPAADGTRTRVRWQGALANVGTDPAPGMGVFHLRDRASLFGFNAPHPQVLSDDQRARYGFVDDSDWAFSFAGTTRLHLDNIYKGFVAGGWMLLEAPDGTSQAFRIGAVADDTRADYAISGKALRVDVDTDGAALGDVEDVYRGVSIYGGSVELPLAEAPIEDWVTGAQIVLDREVPDLPEGRRLVIKGHRPLLEVRVRELLLLEEGTFAPRTLQQGDRLTLIAPPIPFFHVFVFRVRLQDGTTGLISGQPDNYTILPPSEGAEALAIPAVLKEVQAGDPGHSVVVLEDALEAALDRTSLTVHANVARAAHGEGTTEILGHGDPSQPFQKFLLKQAPVTHRLAQTETGVDSTLSIRIDGVEWDEVPDLYQRGPSARVFKTALTDEGHTIVEFGDGVSGARPTPGRDNIVAHHSKGLGAAGNLRAGQLKLPLDRPLGMKEADNPLPATGGADAEVMSEARRNAPIYTLTLGRVVSLTDYRDFALGFPGIAKAEARWVWQGETRRIVVTVAGVQGAEVATGSTTHTSLLGAFRKLGDPLVSVDLLSYAPAHFRLGLRVTVDPAHDGGTVAAALEAHLRRAFAFEARDFGEMLSLAEIAAAAHQVPGVLAVDVDQLYRTAAPQTTRIAHARLVSQAGRTGPGATLLPAEILTLHPDPLDKLEVIV